MCDSYIVKREKRLIENAKKEARAESEQKLAYAKKESTETKIVLKEIADNIDEEGNVKLDKTSIKKILAITSKL